MKKNNSTLLIAKNDFSGIASAILLKVVLNKDLDEKYGLAFVKYYYNDAEKYFKEQVEIQNRVEEMKNKNVTTKKRVVKYKADNKLLKNFQ